VPRLRLPPRDRRPYPAPGNALEQAAVATIVALRTGDERLTIGEVTAFMQRNHRNAARALSGWNRWLVAAVARRAGVGSPRRRKRPPRAATPPTTIKTVAGPVPDVPTVGVTPSGVSAYVAGLRSLYRL